MRQVGFTRPLFDEASEYSHKWAGRLIDSVKDKVDVKGDLSGEEATRESVEDILEAYPKMDFVFHDHGAPEGLVQQGGEGYVIDKKNDHLLKGRVVYTVACSWGSDGAIHAWQQGAEVVVCYYDPFAFTPYDEELFCKAANSGYVAIANGEEDPKKMKQIMIEEYNDSIDKTDDPWSKIWLRRDRDALRIYNAEEPKTECRLRMLSLTVFGRRGWFITGLRGASIALAGIGTGIYIHDRIVQGPLLGYRLHGIDVGVMLIGLAFLIGFYDFLKVAKWSRKR